MSKIDVRNNALVLAGESDDYTTPDGTKAVKADALLVRLHAQWIDDGLVSWELDDMPLRAEVPVESLLGYEIGKRKRSIDPKRLVDLRGGAIQGEIELRKQSAIPQSGEPVQAEYF